MILVFYPVSGPVSSAEAASASGGKSDPSQNDVSQQLTHPRFRWYQPCRRHHRYGTNEAWVSLPFFRVGGAFVLVDYQSGLPFFGNRWCIRWERGRRNPFEIAGFRRPSTQIRMDEQVILPYFEGLWRQYCPLWVLGASRPPPGPETPDGWTAPRRSRSCPGPAP